MAYTAYHTLKAAGMTWGKIDIISNIEFLKYVIIPTLMYGCEHTTPSVHDLDNANRVLATAIKTIYGLPKQTNNNWSLWEAGIKPAHIMWEDAIIRLNNKTLINTNTCAIKAVQEQLKQTNKQLQISTIASKITQQRNMRAIYPNKEILKKTLQIQSDREFIKWFSKWTAKDDENGKHYRTIKPWYGTFLSTIEMENRKEARAIHEARANIIGTDLDKRIPKEHFTLECKHCKEKPWDTLDHAVLLCSNTDIQKQIKKMRIKLHKKHKNMIPDRNLTSSKITEGCKYIDKLLTTDEPCPEDEQIHIRTWHYLAKNIITAQKLRKF